MINVRVRVTDWPRHRGLFARLVHQLRRHTCCLRRAHHFVGARRYGSCSVLQLTPRPGVSSSAAVRPKCHSIATADLLPPARSISPVYRACMYTRPRLSRRDRPPRSPDLARSLAHLRSLPHNMHSSALTRAAIRLAPLRSTATAIAFTSRRRSLATDAAAHQAEGGDGAEAVGGIAPRPKPLERLRTEPSPRDGMLDAAHVPQTGNPRPSRSPPTMQTSLQSEWWTKVVQPGTSLPPVPTSSSSRSKSTQMLFAGLKHVNEILREINLRSTLRRQARYEKPAAKRVRLRSERHRRRFAARIGDSVAQVMAATARGM